ncbi:MAG TPA: DUF488 domain-containing protein [Cyclobacteriaceae bacterium]|nr:DUF488 domain-containing protein [Cyclobacteriaceae bacterium]
MKLTIYTIGHSKHGIGYFIDLLKTWSINCVVDVRSVAASRFNPQYNKNKLSASLKEADITYLHMPDEFGARQTSPELLTNGKVDFQKMRKSSKFRAGVDRLKDGVKKGYTIALMCAEADPLECHRFSMVSADLKNNGFDILHILKDARTISNSELEQELLKKYKKKILTSNLFASVATLEERLAAAYQLQNQDIAFSSEQS